MSRIRVRKTRYVAVIAVVVMSMCICCCLGRVDRPEVVAKRMVGAYGGPDKARLLSTFKGLGFMKNLSTTSVAENFPYDVYQKGPLYKSKITVIKQSQVTGVRINIFDGRERYIYEYGKGKRSAPAWEFDFVKYKFPFVLEWIQNPGDEGTVVHSDTLDAYLLRYVIDDDIVTFTIDEASWLLEKVEVGSVADSTFAFSESYSDYREVDGVPFPNRFEGSFKGRKYYEFFISAIEYGIELSDSFFKVMEKDTSWAAGLAPAAKAGEAE